MNNYNKNRERNFGRNSRGFRDRNSGRDSRNRRPIEEHEVICDECGKQTTVPFKPTGSKPVLCRDCFKKSGNNRGRDSQRNSGQQSNFSQEQFNELKEKLDKILNILEDVEIEQVEEEEDLE